MYVYLYSSRRQQVHEENKKAKLHKKTTKIYAQLHTVYVKRGIIIDLILVGGTWPYYRQVFKYILCFKRFLLGPVGVEII